MAKDLKFELMPYQWEFAVDTEHGEQGFKGGFGAGKSFAAVVKSIFLSAIHRGKTGAILSPTYGMTKRNLIPIFRKLNEKHKLGIRGLNAKNPSVLEIDWGGKTSLIYVDISAENHDRLNGITLAWAGLDEADKCNSPEVAELAWMQMGSRLRDPAPGKKGIRFATSTPEGFGFMYSTFAENLHSDKVLYTASMLENYMLPPSYIESQKRTLPAHLYKPYILGEFTNIHSNVVYCEFDRKLNHTDLTLADLKKDETLYLGMDFNNNGMSAIGFVIRDDKEYVLYENIGATNTPALCRKIKKDLVDRGIKFIVVPDPSCIQNTSVSDDTNLVILRRHQFRIDLMNIAPEVQDRVNSVNARFNNVDGVRSLFVNTTVCPLLTKALLQQPYNAAGEPQKKIKLAGTTHTQIDGPLDALGYAVFRKRPLQNPRAKRITITGF